MEKGYLLFGSEGTAGSEISRAFPGASLVDKPLLDYRYLYLESFFEDHLDRIINSHIEKGSEKISIIASGKNPDNKVSSLRIKIHLDDDSKINFLAPFRICQKLVEKKFEKIIVFTSASSVACPAGCAEYSAWKAALNAAVLSLAAEAADTKIVLYSPGKGIQHLVADIQTVLRAESGTFYARLDSGLTQIPLGEKCGKATLQTDRSSK